MQIEFEQRVRNAAHYLRLPSKEVAGYGAAGSEGTHNEECVEMGCCCCRVRRVGRRDHLFRNRTDAVCSRVRDASPVGARATQFPVPAVAKAHNRDSAMFPPGTVRTLDCTPQGVAIVACDKSVAGLTYDTSYPISLHGKCHGNWGSCNSAVACSSAHSSEGHATRSYISQNLKCDVRTTARHGEPDKGSPFLTRDAARSRFPPADGRRGFVESFSNHHRVAGSDNE